MLKRIAVGIGGMIFLPVIFLYLSFSLHAQCCSHGTPAGSDRNLGTLEKYELRTTLMYRHNHADKYFFGDAASSFQYVSLAAYDFTGINISYGILNRLTADVETGYYLNKIQRYVNPALPELKGKGITDMTALAKYGVYKNPTREIETTVSAGVKFPTGQYYQWVNNVKLPRELQSGTGAYSFVSTVFFYKGFTEKKLRFFLTGRIQINGTNKEKGAGGIVIAQYRYGNEYSSSLYCFYTVSHRFSVLMQTRGEWREKDMDKKINWVFPNSGSRKVFIIPQINYNIAQKWSIGVLGEVPVYQYVNGTQLGSRFAAAFLITRDFALKKGQIDIPIQNE